MLTKEQLTNALRALGVKEGKLKRTTCGEAEVALLSARDFVDLTVKLLREHDEGVMSTRPPLWTAEANLAWMRRIENLT